MSGRAAAELCRRSFARFLSGAWPLLEPARARIDAWHTDAIAEHLQAVSKGQIKRLIVNVPPGTGKSTLVATAWPSWVWTWRSTWKLIGASYAHNLAVRDAMRMRDIVRSDWYRKAFGVELRADIDRQDDFANTAGGRRLATSVGAGTTGWRADALLIDDALPASAAYSKAQRDEAERWYRGTMTSRLDDPANAAIVVVGQRLAVDDLPGRLIGEGGWETLVLPSEFDPRRRCVTSIGWQDPRTEPDEPLFPALYGKGVLAQARVDLGSAAYAAQHLQTPIDAEGGMFQTEWFRFHGHGIAPRPEGCYTGPAKPLPERFDRMVISVDATFKASASSDFVAMSVWGSRGAEYFLLDLVRKRLGFVDTVASLRTLCAKWPQAGRVLVEAAANGEAIIDVLRAEIRGVIGVKAKESKEARAASVSPLFEAGQVFLPDGAPYLADFIAELAAFPRAANDDVVDSTSMALRDFAGGAVHALHLERGPFAVSRSAGPTDEWGRPLGGYR